MTLLKYNNLPQITEPKIFFISLHAQNQGDVLIWHTALAAFNLETASSEAIHSLKTTNADLYQRGQILGGWVVKNHIELPAMKIDQMLSVAYDSRDDIELEKERQIRNELMTTIIETASRKLLEKYKDRFTDAEYAYLEEEIRKYEQNAK